MAPEPYFICIKLKQNGIKYSKQGCFVQIPLHHFVVFSILGYPDKSLITVCRILFFSVNLLQVTHLDFFNEKTLFHPRFC